MFKILLCGNDSGLINRFFASSDDSFSFMSSSMNFEDLTNHLEEISNLTALCFCLKNVETDQLYVINTALNSLYKKIHIIVICPNDEQKKFTQHVSNAIVDTFFSSNLPFQDLYKSFKTFMAPINEEKVVEIANESSNTTKNKKKILIIDDDPVMLRTVKTHLEKEYTVAAAISGKVALKYLQTKIVDLILLDYEMPEMNGVEFLTEFRNTLDLSSSIPVVFLTGSADKTVIQKAVSMKARGYLLKPVDPKKLIEMTVKILG